MNHIEVVAYYDTPRGGYRRLAIAGESKERFVDAFRRALGHMPSTDDYSMFVREWEGEEAERDVVDSRFPNYVEVPSSTTMAQIAAFVDGEPFVVTEGGWGGDGWFEPLVTIWEASGLEITMMSLWAAARRADGQISSIRYRRHRALAADWRDEGDRAFVPLELSQMVKSKHEWHRAQFDTVFGLDPATGSELLRALNYRKVQSAPREIWCEVGGSCGPYGLGK